LKEWTTTDFRNTPSTTNLEEEEIVDAPGNDGNTSMSEQVRRSNPRRKMILMMNVRVSWQLLDGVTIRTTTLKDETRILIKEC